LCYEEQIQQSEKGLKAICPKPITVPIANPSPKLCIPIPIAIINPMAKGLEYSVRLIREVFQQNNTNLETRVM